MKLIEADKAKRVMKDYWKAQVDKALTLTFTDSNEANKRINSYLEHNHELLKAIDELPSIQPNHCAEVGKKVLIDRQEALETIRKMQTYKLFAGDDMLLIDQAEAQTELMMLPSAQPEPHEIGYSECANAMLKMWIDNVLTDGEYNRIMDKLNAHWAERREDEAD